MAKANAPEIRNSVWSIGISRAQYMLKASDGEQFLGVSSIIHLGKGNIYDNWFLTYFLDVISGPYSSQQRETLKIDFRGTGISIFTGYNAEQVSIRTEDGSYGFGLGFNYFDVIGRADIDEQFYLSKKGVDNYVMRITQFSLIPSIFFSWLKSGRAVSNNPDQLKTRIEGSLLTIGVSMPLLANYHVRYGEYSFSENDSSGRTQSMSKKGELKGYTIIVSYLVLFGV